MIDIKVNIDIDDFYNDVSEAIDRACKRTAEFVAIDTRNKIAQRKKPSGGSQKENAPSTKRYKRKKYGHDIPLRQKGILSDPSLFKITKRGQAVYEVSPPVIRQRVINYVRQKGYEIFEISDEIENFLQKALQEELNKVKV